MPLRAQRARLNPMTKRHQDPRLAYQEEMVCPDTSLSTSISPGWQNREVSQLLTSMKPYKFDDIKRAKDLGCLRSGMRRGAAARASGITHQAVWEHQKANPDFALRCQEAEEMACDVVEDALWRKAMDGNTTAIIFWLKNRSPVRWQDRRNPGKQQPSQYAAQSELFKAILARLEAHQQAETDD